MVIFLRLGLDVRKDISSLSGKLKSLIIWSLGRWGRGVRLEMIFRCSDRKLVSLVRSN